MKGYFMLSFLYKLMIWDECYVESICEKGKKETAPIRQLKKELPLSFLFLFVDET